MFNKKVFVFLTINFVSLQLHAMQADPYVETTAIVSAAMAATSISWLGECLLKSQCGNDCSSYYAGTVIATIVSLASLYRCANPYRNSSPIITVSSGTTVDLCKSGARALMCGLNSVKRSI